MTNFEIRYNVLASYTGNEEVVEIPEGVIYIGHQAFMNNQTIRKVYIPEGVIKIDFDAFRCCSSLEEIIFPSTLRTIGDHAFSSCTALTQVNFSERISHIHDSAFENCKNLQTVNFPSTPISIGTKAFYKCEQLETATVPHASNIGPFAFDGCIKLKGDRLLREQQDMKKEPAVMEWLEENMDKLLGELIEQCTGNIAVDPAMVAKAEAFLKKNAGEDERFAAAYILISAIHALDHDADEGYFPLVEACRMFVKYDAEDACREMADSIEMEEAYVDRLMRCVKFYILGL